MPSNRQTSPAQAFSLTNQHSVAVKSYDYLSGRIVRNASNANHYMIFAYAFWSKAIAVLAPFAHRRHTKIIINYKKKWQFIFYMSHIKYATRQTWCIRWRNSLVIAICESSLASSSDQDFDIPSTTRSVPVHGDCGGDSPFSTQRISTYCSIRGGKFDTK